MFSNKEKREQEAREKAERESRAAAEKAERLRQAKERREQGISEFLAQFAARVEATVMSGTPVTLFRNLYLPVDAQMNTFGPPSGLDLSVLNSSATEGWSVVSVIPRTYGGFESYKISKTTAYGVSGWGKDEHKVGLGGHIVGVYALLSFTVNKENLEFSKNLIATIASESLPESLTTPVT